MKMTRLKEIRVMVAIVLILLVGGLILFPFVLIFIIIGGSLRLMRTKRSSNAYSRYLRTLEGKNFFCYNNRKKGLEYIEKEVIPYLPPQVEVLYLHNREIRNSPYDFQYLSKAFYGFENYSRFPHLLKIRNGKPLDTSLNNELFACLDQAEGKSAIDKKIAAFFELEA